MADVTCSLTREDWRGLLADDALPPELRAVLEDPARTVELAHGYEMELTAVEATALQACAEGHGMRGLSGALRQELNGYRRRKREGGKPS